MQRYFEWTSYFSEFAYFPLLRAIPSLSLAQRKAVLTYCRVQPSVLSGSRYETRIGATLDSTVLVRKDANQHNSKVTFAGNPVPLRVFLGHVNPDPVICAIVAAAVIAAPYYTWDEVILAREETRLKEEAAGIATNFINMNYSSWLGSSWFGPSADIPLYEELGPSPHTSRLIADTFNTTRSTIENARIYPDIKRKTFGREASKEVRIARRQFPDYTHSDGTTIIETHRDLEEFYHRTGVQLLGRTEMRSAWKFNDFKPRCYYAMGPTHYFASRYIQSIFNVLVDAFPMCHRKERFSIPRHNVWGQNIRSAIYDYASFTSSLTEIYRFTQALGEYFSQTSVMLLDTHHGWVTVSLGDVILDYNDAANKDNEVDLSALLGLPYAELMFHQAGLLGVPGNISSCTLLHALHLATVVGSLTRCKCVGDDAFLILEIEPDDQQAWLWYLARIGTLGTLSAEKVETWDLVFDIGEMAHEPDASDGWHYVKRPIYPFESSMLSGELLRIPSLELLLELEDPIHKPSPALASEFLKLRGLCAQLYRFLVTFKNLEHPSEDMSASAFAVMVAVKRKVLKNKHTKVVGCQVFRYWSSSAPPDYVGFIPRFMTRQEFQDYNLESLYIPQDSPIVTLHVPLPWDGSDDIIQNYPGYTFRCSGNMSKMMTVLRKLHYLSTELVTTKVAVNTETDRALFALYLAGNYVYTYDVTVVHSLPSWAI